MMESTDDRQPAPDRLDLRPLTDPVALADVDAHALRLRAAGRVPRRFTHLGNTINTIALAGLIVLGGVFGLVFAFATVTSFLLSGVRAAVTNGAVFVAIVVALIWFVRRARGQQRHVPEHWFRLTRFAAANGLDYWPVATGPHPPGVLFDRRGDGEIIDLLRLPGVRADVGAFEFQDSTDDPSYRWGFAALPLDRDHAPALLRVRSARANRVFHVRRRDWAHAIHDPAAQIPRTLYFAHGREAEARDALTPALVALIDAAPIPLDIEFAGRRLLLYSSVDLVTTDPQRWRLLEQLLGEVRRHLPA